MAINLGVKALLSWVKSMKLSGRELTIDDLQDGEVLLKVAYMLKKEPIPCFSNSIEDRFKLIADFVERDCRFVAAKGASLSLDNIRNGVNLTVEIAKVLLLLVYHDIMNDRCTLNQLECDVEKEIANLTGSYVMESNGYVHLSDRIDSYFTRRCLPVQREIFDRPPSSSGSSVSTLSLSDDESPLFNRKQKITFVDVHTVASSSVSKSPLQDIMNTPKFQMRKMQRQMIKERDYRDGLERELASKISLISQRESHINQLQHRFDKLKEQQGDQEQVIKEQIIELETKNSALQKRLEEMMKHNKDFKSTSLLMERKVDELTDENGILSSRMRATCSQLAIFETEVVWLRETQTSSQEEWTNRTSHLLSELNQTTAQKELLTEQIEILQGKISCLEDDLSRAAMEEKGENMGPVMEREMFETQISTLKNELEGTLCSMKKAEREIQDKTQQLAEYQQEISRQSDLLQQQWSKSEEIIQAKDEILNELQREITEQRAVLQQETQELEFQLEQVKHQNNEQVAKLQQHIAACEQEVEKLKELQKEKEDLLCQTEEKLKDLETKFSAASSLLADKDQEIHSLSEEVDHLNNETKRNKHEIQTKEEMLSKLIQEKSNEQEVHQNKMQTMTVQVDHLTMSLQQAEQEIQLKQDLLAKAQEETVQQRELLQQSIETSEVEFQKLNNEIQVKSEQLLVLKNDSSQQSELLEQEIKALKGQLEILKDSLKKAEEQVCAQEVSLTNQEQERARQTELLHQKLTVSEERVRSMEREIQTKEEQMAMLKTESLEQSDLLHQQIQDLKAQVEGLSSSLSHAEENLHSKENLLTEQQVRSTQDMEALRVQMEASQDEVKRLNAEICAKEEQLTLLKTETSTHSDVVQKEIQTLTNQVLSLSESLKTTVEQVQAKESLLIQKEVEISEERGKLQNMMTTSEAEMKGLQEQIQAKEEQLVTLQKEGSMHSEMLQQEIKCLKTELTNTSESLTKSEETIQTQLCLLTKQEQENAHRNELLIASEEKVRKMKEEIQTKEDQIMLLKTDSSEHSELLHQQIQDLKTQVEGLNSSLTHAKENLHSKENRLAEQQVQSTQDMEALRVQMEASQDEVKRLNAEICAKEEQLTLLKTETSTHSDVVQKEIQTLTNQVLSLSESLKTTVEQVQAKESLLIQKEVEISEERGKLQNMMTTSEVEMNRLQQQIQAKEEQLVTLEKEGSMHSEMLQQEIKCLKTELINTSESLTKSEETIQTQLCLLTKQEQENAHRNELLIASEKKVRKMKEEIQTKEDQIMLLKTDSSEHSELLHQQIQDLKTQVEGLNSSLTHAKENLHSKENRLAEQQVQSTQDMEALRVQMEASQDEVKRLNADICAKEEQLTLLKTETSTHSDVLQKEIQTLTDQVLSLSESLKTTVEQVQAQESLLIQKAVEISEERGKLQNMMTTSEVEMNGLQQQIQAKEEQLVTLEKEGSMHSEMLQQEIKCLKTELTNTSESLTKSEETIQTQLCLLTKQEQENAHRNELLIASEKKVRKMKEEIQTKEDQIMLLKTDSSEQSDLLHQQIQDLETRVEGLSSSLTHAEENLHSKENLFAEKQLQSTQDMEALRVQMVASQDEVKRLNADICAKEEQLTLLKTETSTHSDVLQKEIQTLTDQVHGLSESLKTAVEQVQAKERLLTEKEVEISEERGKLQNMMTTSEAELKGLHQEIQDLKRQHHNSLSEAVITQTNLVQKSREEAEAYEKQLTEIKEQKDLLQQQLEAVNAEMQSVQELQISTFGEKEALVQEKEVLTTRVLRAQQDQKAVEQQLEASLAQTKQALERENTASLKLQQELEILQVENGKLLRGAEKAKENEKLKRDLQEQLSAKSEAAEHYKAQVEKAMSHYNSKKQLLQESQEQVVQLKSSLDFKEQEVKTMTMENKRLQLDLEKAQSNEKKHVNLVASLQAQLAFADHNLREKNKIHGSESSATQSHHFQAPSARSSYHTSVQVKRAMSSDSLDQSSLEDSLNNTRKLSAPDESSTPLVRSSERLAAKRQARTESLETLYFTPIHDRHGKRTGTEQNTEPDSDRKNLTSSMKRRRTTQVFNITLTKKTPGGECDETFYSMASARSQPNLSARPLSMDLFGTPARMTGAASDQLIGLPGYRRSTIHSQPASTFCVGTENEPDGGPDDWMRIAELQSRNKACLPHLKSSYPLEAETCSSGPFHFTDEELRLGDPSDTIRRASTMPGQLQDSLASHRHSLMAGHVGGAAAAATNSHRLSLMPGQLPSRTVGSSKLRSPKGTKRSSTLSVHQSSPEKKVKASCFPRPLTPKNKNVYSGPTSSTLRPALSPVNRRESMVFTIDNTPRKNNYLKKGLNKLRSSTRKSPGKNSTKSPKVAAKGKRKSPRSTH